MTMTDQIVLVKETKTCSYVLIIHTPRLCTEPGFKSRAQVRDEALIRCREIVTSLPPHVIQQQQQQAGSAEYVVMSSEHPVSDLIAPYEPLIQIPAQSFAPPPARGAGAAGNGNGGAAGATNNGGTGSPPTSKLLMESEKSEKVKQDKKLSAIRQAIQALLVAEGNALGLDDEDDDYYERAGEGAQGDNNNGPFRVIQVDEDGNEFVVELEVLDLFFPEDQDDTLEEGSGEERERDGAEPYMKEADVQRSRAIHDAVREALRGVGYSVDDTRTTTKPKKSKQQQQQQQQERRRKKEYSGPYDEL
jgi:hypothetical protein